MCRFAFAGGGPFCHCSIWYLAGCFAIVGRRRHGWEAATWLGGGGAVKRRWRGELGGVDAGNREGSWLGGLASGDPVRHSRSLSLWAPPQIAPNSPNKHLFGGIVFLGGLDANNPNLTLMFG